MLIPLLLKQKYIKSVKHWMEDTQVDFDLDIFRQTPQNFRAGTTPNYYFPLFGVAPDTSKPWISVETDGTFNDFIVLARSCRYRNNSIDYSALNRYGKIYFVGLETEFEEMRGEIKKLEYVKVRDFLELAIVIKSSKLFIGNQSFPFALAEAMKTPRVHEVCPWVPNVIPNGGVAHSILFQKQFDFVVNNIMEFNDFFNH